MIARLTKPLLFLAGLIVLFSSIGYLSICWYFSNLILFPAQDPSIFKTYTKIEVNGGVERFVLPSPVSGNIDFWYSREVSNSNCVVIYNHGWGEQRLQSNKFEPAFEQFNCAKVNYDLRGHARRRGETVGGGQLEKYELITIHQWLQNVKGYQENQIIWFGLSWGGATALQAAALNIEPALIVVDSPFQNWESAIFERGVRMYGSWVTTFKSGVDMMLKLRAGVSFSNADVLSQADKIKSPVLIFHSQTDTATDSQQSLNIVSKLNTIYHFEHTNWGADHGDDIDVAPNKYREIVRDFVVSNSNHFLEF